jgi:hypothetical protein
MSKRNLTDTNTTLLTVVDQLFGRHLRTGRWFVDEGLAARGRRQRSSRSDERPHGNALDPTII